MNNKDFFKSVLKDEMPDLEAVKKKCVSPVKRKSIIITVLKSDLVLKTMLPMAACILFTALTVMSIYTSDTPEKFIMPPKYNGEEFAGNVPTDNKAKKKKDKDKKENTQTTGNQNNDYYKENTSKKPQETSQVQETSQAQIKPDTTFETRTDIHFAVPGISKDYVSFSSVDELKNYVSSLYTEYNYVIIESENSFILEIPYNELSMFLEEKKFYTFSINGEVISQNGIIEKYIADNLTGCSFSVNYGGVEYELGYSTYKCTKDTTVNDEFVNYNGYSVKVTDKNIFFMDIDGYHFYVKALTDDTQIAREFVNNLEINCVNID